MARAFAEIAFTPSVRAEQEKMGSADGYAKFLSADADLQNRIGPQEAEFIAARDGFYQASVSETGWPYVQFRGGPKGFLKTLSATSIAYADFRGNRQYISTGNLTKDNRVSLILMDYPNRRRLKIWGKVRLVDTSEVPNIMDYIDNDGYRARPERAVIIDIEAFDWNCPQHIPMRLTAEELEPYFAELNDQIASLTEENQRLKSSISAKEK